MQSKKKTFLIVGIAALAGIYLLTKKNQSAPAQVPIPDPVATQNKLNKGISIAQQLLNLFTQIKSTIPQNTNKPTAGEGYSNNNNIAGITIF